ncbi:hypothetical protein AAFF_G00301510 [Aldrovandia affinis]|uniref:Uncharacterized protein n=1 Tax=Aldrovandia affinis TaxID=143900 RepID=A0AAD7SPR9_9TELE|nr:hypothetical protein AAFF_G00301510 [Aldrovandia affinis]
MHRSAPSSPGNGTQWRLSPRHSADRGSLQTGTCTGGESPWVELLLHRSAAAGRDGLFVGNRTQRCDGYRTSARGDSREYHHRIY